MERTTMKSNMRKNRKQRNQKLEEANARRKVAKSWAEVANSGKYKMAAIKQACIDATSVIIDECFDGILLDLNERNCSKSHNVQKRLLRRIVEKRQAQSIHRTLGRTQNRFSNHLENLNISRSVKAIYNYRFCV